RFHVTVCQWHDVVRDLQSFPTRRSSDLRDTDLDVGLNIRRNTQCRSYGQSQETFLVKRLRHEVVLLEFFWLALQLLSPVLRARRSEEHTSELQSRENLVCRPLLVKKMVG